MYSLSAFHCSVCRHGIFSKMNPCAQVFSPSHLLFPADSQSWKNSCLHGLVVALQGPTWAPFGLSWPLLMSLSLILLPPAGQMFICEAADKEKKAPHSHRSVRREVTAESDTSEGFFPVIWDGGQQLFWLTWSIVLSFLVTSEVWRLKKKANKGFTLPKRVSCFQSSVPKCPFAKFVAVFSAGSGYNQSHSVWLHCATLVTDH